MRGRLWMVAVLAASGCGIHSQRASLWIASRNGAESLATWIGEPRAAATARELEARLSAECSAATLAALAENCSRAGAEAHGEAADLWFRDAAVYAGFAISSSEDRSTTDRAVRAHNHALARLIRSTNDLRFRDRCWTQLFRGWGIEPEGCHPLEPERLSRLRVAADYRVRGCRCYFGNDGFGVPLVPVRPNDRNHPCVPMDRFYPDEDEHRPAATAVLHPVGSPTTWRSYPQRLVLHDPFVSSDVDECGRSLTLASDRTTPLAVQVKHSNVLRVELEGLLRPDRMVDRAGVYALQPYRPGKIPIVFIHGLSGHPSSFVQTFNMLQNDAELSAAYQVWYYLYPSGEAITASAARLRSALHEALAAIDPSGCDPALRKMVLVGHSLGGVVAKMLIQSSGDEIWNAVFAEPFEAIAAAPATKANLADQLFYEPQPFVGRVIFIATSHGGSPNAMALDARLLQFLLRAHESLASEVAEIVRDNGRDVLAPGMQLRRLNGVGNLRPTDPILLATERAPLDPIVPYHSIIPELPWRLRATDGRVPLWSSHIAGAESETITRGEHTSQDSPEVYDELRRILCQNLREQNEGVR